jgi:N-sulfoglucosamine sulfohydrolase
LGEPDREFTRAGTTIDRVGVHEAIETLPDLLGRRGWFRGITQKFHLSPPWKFPFDARDPVDTVPAEFATAVAGFLEKAGDRPFFLMANVSPPHRNFDTHLRKNPNYGPLPDARALAVPDFLPDTPRLRADLAKYIANVEIADQCVAAILAALEKGGHRDDTLIVLTADQGMPYHRAKASVYPAGLHVPLIIAGPGIRGGRSVDAVVSSLDLFPTLLEACGVAAPTGLQGQSLHPYLAGTGPLPERKYVFGAFHSHGPARGEWFPQRMITDGEWYLVLNLHPEKKQELPADLRAAEAWGNDSHAATLAAATTHPLPYRLLREMEEGRRPNVELYHLPSDPWAIRNRASEPVQATRVAELLSALGRWRTETGDYQNWPDEIPTR